MGAVAVGGLSAGQRASVGWRLGAWLGFVGLLALIAYLGRLADEDGDPARDALYRYETAVAAVIFYGFVLGVVVLLSLGLPKREVFGLTRPRSIARSIGYALGALLLIYVAAGALTWALDLDAGREQGLTPEGWDSSRANAYALNFVAVAVIGPLVEELVYRGFGFWAVRAVWGTVAAVVITAVMFSLAHGLVEGFLVLTVFGLVLGWLRHATTSVWPGVVLHSAFNAIALILAVTVESDL
jgi:membrane protease YdiL (CAAX protease family)